MTNLRRMILATIFLVSVSAALAWADDDPPGRVARLQYMSGSVSIQPQGTQDWVEGAVNRPLTNSDNVWTDKDSKAELNVGGGLLRMGDESSLTLTNVTNQNVQVELHQGTLNLHVRDLFGGEIYEVDTPNIAFTVQKSGDYRFDVDPNGDTTVVTVRKGEGDATGNGPGVRIKSNEQVQFSNSTSLEHTVAEAPAYDGFDSWCGTRNDREDHSISAQYVAPGVIGTEDLDDNGVWTEVPTYGHIWVPRHVAVGWAPYQDGHWAYIAPWGWTWVDNAPWGFAPFHYGRWVHYGGGWGWAPGPVYVAPVYAPALVAWFGGPSWGVSFGVGGGFGWCPLGWGEPFYPWYHHGYGYFRQVNISNTRITNINNYYGHPPTRGQNLANYHVPGGFTAAPARTLQNGLSVARTGMHVSQNQLGNAPMLHGPGVTPTRNAILGAHAGQPAAIPPARSFSRPVVTRAGGPVNAGRAVGMETARNIPREGVNSAAMPNRTLGAPPQNTGAANNGHYVPRPPTAGGTFNRAQPVNHGQPESRGGSFAGNSPQHNAPQPPANFSRNSGAGMSASRGPVPATQSVGSFGRSTSVPRPTGPVRPASQIGRGSGPDANTGRNYGYTNSSASRGGNSPRYGSAPSYGGQAGYGSQGSARQSAPSYQPSGPSYHASSPAPAYHGGGGSTPSYHASGSSYGGGGSAHGGGGGGGSYHGGGSGGSSHGGSSGGRR